MSKRLEETVCSACGEAQCWQGDLMCYEAQGASILPRWRWEYNEAVSRLAALAPTTGQDGTLLHAVSVVERRMTEAAS